MSCRHGAAPQLDGWVVATGGATVDATVVGGGVATGISIGAAVATGGAGGVVAPGSAGATVAGGSGGAVGVGAGRAVGAVVAIGDALATVVAVEVEATWSAHPINVISPSSTDPEMPAVRIRAPCTGGPDWALSDAILAARSAPLADSTPAASGSAVSPSVIVGPQ
jgi:hypothetical protein